ncbi:uncharacterized protein [Typha angustifolia]|uniref:uncharacterized protein n=1 Tax=Typha angustifolia TaxID=59011 RepID=UPI003C2BDEC5
MRIRKCASKLLGSASAYASGPQSQLWASSSSPAAPWDATVSTSGLICELNRSPWDLMMPDLELASLQDDGDGGTMGNGVKLEQDQEDDEEGEVPISTIARREEKKTKKKIEKKKKVAKKEVEESKVSAVDTVSICKKTDGKGWHCKRPAHHPHSLCQYHLAQLRSYSTNYGASKASTSRAGADAKSRKKKVGDDDASTNLYYYYYSGFGPWRGKRRGGSRGDNGGGESVGNEQEEEEEEEEEEEVGRNNSGARDTYEDSVAVAGGDEESNGEDDGMDSDGSDDDDDDDDDTMRNRRKRGRKPVKARSLKSLL